MTSRSLRKHQITPWSMLQRISSEPASSGLARWLRDTTLAGLAIITLASGSIAGDQTGRARISLDAAESPAAVSGKARLESESPQPSASISGKTQLESNSQEQSTDVSGITRFVSEAQGSPARIAGRARIDSAAEKSSATDAGKAKHPKERWARSKNRIPVSPATLSRILPTNELPPENLFPSATKVDFAVHAAAGTLSASKEPAFNAAVSPVSAEDVSAAEIPFGEATTGNAQASELLPAEVTVGDTPSSDTLSDRARKTELPIEEIPDADAMPIGDTEFDAAAMQDDAAVDETATGTHYSAEVLDTFESAHRRRMDYLMNGGSPDAISSVSDWWHEHSLQYVINNRHLAGVSGEWWHEHSQNYVDNNRHVVDASRNSAREFMIEHTLPEYTVPEVDFYDSNPIALSSPSTQQQIPEEVPEESGELTGTSRLKTDIRTIKPTLSYALKGIDRNQLPDDFDERIDNGEYVARQTSPTVLQWAPTNLWHYPLYFEDPSLERYGHSYHPLVQPFASTGRFATQLVGLPYQMTLHPVHSKEYALGYYRPGECAPKKFYQIPFNEEATMMQVATIAGLILIFP